jgi:flagellar basal body-associated protein FliL
MAELHVQRKSSSSLWVWLFIILLIAAAGAYFYVHYYQKDHSQDAGRPRASLQIRPASSFSAV